MRGQLCMAKAIKKTLNTTPAHTIGLLGTIPKKQLKEHTIVVTLKPIRKSTQYTTYLLEIKQQIMRIYTHLQPHITHFHSCDNLLGTPLCCWHLFSNKGTTSSKHTQKASKRQGHL